MALTPALVVPIHNALPYTQRLLRQLATSLPDTPLLLVNDASTPVVGKWLTQYALGRREAGQEVVLLENARQQLFTRTVNRGLRAAELLWEPDVQVVINTDCDLQEGWLEQLLWAFRHMPRTGICGYAQKPDGQPAYYRQVQEPAYVTGHCLALRSQLLREIGVLCETDLTGRDSPELAPYLGQAHIGSDRLLSWRANRAGWDTFECHYDLCQHAEGKSWKHDLGWLHRFVLDPLWEPCDTLEEPVWR